LGEHEKTYTLKPVKPSDVPTRGKWKAIALDIIEQLDTMPERNVEILNNGEPIKSKKELQALYDALKAIIRKNKLNVDVKTEGGKLFLVKDMRYFVK